ncbi:hypothetical protein Tco_1363514 [Tanacetum coccineum]
MHNNIMAAGSRDRPPMLATGRYAQWRSRFLRYIDTRPNGDALRKCILKVTWLLGIMRTLALERGVYGQCILSSPGADTMLCGFRLTNRWLSMKKDIASCGSKYLAYSRVEVEYQGSSGLLLQPEWGLSFEYGCASFEAWSMVVEGLTLERCSKNFCSYWAEYRKIVGSAEVWRKNLNLRGFFRFVELV